MTEKAIFRLDERSDFWESRGCQTNEFPAFGPPLGGLLHFWGVVFLPERLTMRTNQLARCGSLRQNFVAFKRRRAIRSGGQLSRCRTWCPEIELVVPSLLKAYPNRKTPDIGAGRTPAPSCLQTRPAPYRTRRDDRGEEGIFPGAGGVPMPPALPGGIREKALDRTGKPRQDRCGSTGQPSQEEYEKECVPACRK